MISQIGPIQSVAPMTIANHGSVHQIRKILETREVGIFFSKLDPMAELPLEVHPFVEIIYRLQGKTTMRIGDDDYLVEPGTFAIVPEGVWHQSKSIERDSYVEQLVLCAYNQSAGHLLDQLRTKRTELRPADKTI